MSLIEETGAGVPNADTYADRAFIIQYWTDRPHDALGQAFITADPDKQDGAAREATAYLDATFGPRYLGQRRGYVQGRLFPRTGAKDEAGYELPGRPKELQVAVAELSARAVKARLAKDAKRGGKVKRVKVEGAVEQEFFEGAPLETHYGFVAGLLAPILRDEPANPAGDHWNWS